MAAARVKANSSVGEMPRRPDLQSCGCERSGASKKKCKSLELRRCTEQAASICSARFCNCCTLEPRPLRSSFMEMSCLARRQKKRGIGEPLDDLDNPGRTAHFGQARRKQVGRQQHDALQPKARHASALELARALHARPRARAHQAQVRADGRVALRLLSRRGAGDGRGPGRAALHRHRQPALRRRACAQPGRLCRARRPPGLRHQRLRRDHPRPLRVGPEAHGRLAGAGRARRRATRKPRRARPWKHASSATAAQMRAFARMPLLEVGRFQVHRLGLAKPVHAGAAQGRARHAAAHAGTAYRARIRQARRAAPLQGSRSPC